MGSQKVSRARRSLIQLRASRSLKMTRYYGLESVCIIRPFASTKIADVRCHVSETASLTHRTPSKVVHDTNLDMDFPEYQARGLTNAVPVIVVTLRSLLDRYLCHQSRSMCLRLRQVRANVKANHLDTKMLQNQQVTALCSSSPGLDPLQLFGEASAPAMEWGRNAGQKSLLGAVTFVL